MRIHLHYYTKRLWAVMRIHLHYYTKTLYAVRNSFTPFGNALSTIARNHIVRLCVKGLAIMRKRFTRFGVYLLSSERFRVVCGNITCDYEKMLCAVMRMHLHYYTKTLTRLGIVLLHSEMLWARLRGNTLHGYAETFQLLRGKVLGDYAMHFIRSGNTLLGYAKIYSGRESLYSVIRKSFARLRGEALRGSGSIYLVRKGFVRDYAGTFRTIMRKHIALYYVKALAIMRKRLRG